jgi:hypothetical protein
MRPDALKPYLPPDVEAGWLAMETQMPELIKLLGPQDPNNQALLRTVDACGDHQAVHRAVCGIQYHLGNLRTILPQVSPCHCAVHHGMGIWVQLHCVCIHQGDSQNLQSIIGIVTHIANPPRCLPLLVVSCYCGSGCVSC